LVLSTLCPAAFVAKSELKGWPVLGWLAQLGGTIFVERDRKSGAAQACQSINAVLQEHVPVVLFAEGTSSGGRSVLPFRSSLLQIAAEGRCPLAVAYLEYALPDGDVSEEVCYWKDMTFVPHLWHLFARPVVEASVRFKQVQFCADRKQLATLLRQEIQQLARPIGSPQERGHCGLNGKLAPDLLRMAGS
jgi:1-acyl-sn-glycerol-3-phosphate acyltransferase